MEQAFTFRNGMEVFGSDGGKVGKIVEVEPQYLVVEKGFFFPSDHFIPTSSVSSVGVDDKVYLSVTKDAALNQGWENAPERMDDDREVTTPMMAGHDTASEGFISDQIRQDTAGAMMPEAENPTSYAGDPAYRDADRAVITSAAERWHTSDPNAGRTRGPADREVMRRTRRDAPPEPGYPEEFMDTGRDAADTSHGAQH